MKTVEQNVLNIRALDALKQLFPTSITTPNQKARNSKRLNILTIDGGGIRGILPATIIAYLEKQIQAKTGNPHEKLSNYIDFYAGTSTGGILVALYLMGNHPFATESKFSAEEVLDLYLDKGHSTFAPSITDKLASRKKLVEQKYSSAPLENHLKEVLGEHTGLSQLVKPALFTAYDLIERSPVLFKSWEAKFKQGNDYKAWEVCRATSAAPGFFEPAVVDSFNNNAPLIDGSVFAGNPAMCAYTEARNIAFSQVHNTNYQKDFPVAKNMFLVSISTGSNQKIEAGALTNGKGLNWIRPVIEILLSSGVDMTHQQLEQIFLSPTNRTSPNYHRLEADLNCPNSTIDNAGEANIENLYECGLQYIEKNKSRLDGIVESLLGKEH